MHWSERMFSTKQDALDWINEFAKDLRFKAIKRGKYWRICDAAGVELSEIGINDIEASREIEIPYPEGCKLCNVATGCDFSCLGDDETCNQTE